MAKYSVGPVADQLVAAEKQSSPTFTLPIDQLPSPILAAELADAPDTSGWVISPFRIWGMPNRGGEADVEVRGGDLEDTNT